MKIKDLVSHYPQRVIGLLPAGGQATRIAPLPMSKELYPIGFRRGANGSLRPKVVCHYLLEKMRQAGVTTAYLVLRPGKWDIPNYFGDGTMLDMHLAYLTVHVPFGVPYTLDQAYPFVQDAVIALGFPDILFQPQDAFAKILARQANGSADVVLGLFPTEQPSKAGMVDFDLSGRVRYVIEKPLQTDLRYMWAIATWTPKFTHFMHEYLKAIASQYSSDSESLTEPRPELPIGDVIQAAIDQGFRVEAEVFEQGRYLDIGTPENLAQAVRDAYEANW
ncbi:sugar phosphate nucleotidyltransferase [Oculatella sp. FACHB-28]|uniref:sugar phosphate nucleotidyltransferase n=1 Tax=Oculatella sp. FACHB-28 TaxID=2692845 RepID=UPI001F5552B7|nr:sugar phosphate nucleotidyltransferase [Oculatella sp. FACHB-28]